MKNKIKNENELRDKIKRELSPTNTIQEVCDWMRKNRVCPSSLGTLLNLILETDKFYALWGRALDSDVDAITIIENYTGSRDISHEKLVLELYYKDILLLGKKYIFPNNVGDLCVKDLL